MSDARMAPLDLLLADEHGNPTDTLLWLENGGGKTTLLGLTLSVVRPAFREFLGLQKTKNNLHEYIDDDDTAHIVLEWARPSRNGIEQLITGQTLQWRDLRADRQHPSERLQRAFYAFRATPTFGLDQLPFTNDGNRHRLDSYLEQLRGLFKNHQTLDHFDTRQQVDWLRYLNDTLKLDTELYRYLIEMNVDEGAIDETIARLDSNDTAVQWILDVALGDDTPRNLAEHLTRMRHQIEQQPHLELEAEFCETAHARLTNVADAHDLAGEHHQHLTTTVDQAEQLLAALQAASDQAAEQQRNSQQDAKRAQQRADTASRTNANLRRQATSAERELHRLAVEAARHHVTEAGRRHDDLQMLVDAWTAADLLIITDRLEADARRLDAELAAVEQDLAPLRDEHATARGQLAAKLRHLKQVATKAARSEEEAARTAEAQALQADAEAEEAGNKAQGIWGKISTLNSQLSQVDDDLSELHEQGLLTPGDDLIDTAAAAAQRVEQLDRRRKELQQELQRTRNRRNELDQTRRAHDQGRADLQTSLQRAQDAIATFHKRIAHIATRPSIQQAADTDGPVERQLLLEDGTILERHLDDLLHDIRTDEVRLRLEIDSHQRFVDTVDTDGRVPASDDITAVLQRLDLAGIAATSGWQHLADTVSTGERAQLAREHPHVAGGVIVQNPDQLVDAEATLDGWRPTSGPVLVTSRHAFDSPTATPDGTFVLDAPAGLYDEQAAADEADRRRDQLEHRRSQLADTLTRSSQLHEDLTLLRQLRTDYTPDTITRLEQDETDAIRDLEEHDKVAQQHTDLIEQLTDTNSQLEDDHQQTVNNHSEAASEAHQLQAAAARASKLPEWQEQLEREQGRYKTFTRQRQEHQQQAGKLRAAAKAHEVRAERHKSEAGRHEERLSGEQLTAGDAETHPVPDQPVEVLLKTYQRAAAALDANRTHEPIQQELSNVRGQLTELQGTLDQTDPQALDTARELMADVGVDNASERHQRARQAEADLGQARQDAWEADRRLREAEDAQREFAAAGRDTGPLEHDPTTVDEARQMMADLNERAAGQRRIQVEADRDVNTARLQAEAAKSRATQFDNHIRRLTEETLVNPYTLLDRQPAQPTNVDVFPGSLEDANGQVGDLATTLRQQASDLTEARTLRDSAAREVVDLTRERRFDTLAEDATRDNLVRRLTEAADLAEHARTLADQFATRKITIDKDLEDIRRHREQFVELLAAVASKALSLLASVSRTKMPDGLGEWSNRPFLRINFDPLPEDTAVVQTRLQELLSRLIDGGLPADTPLKLGRRLVFEAAKAACGGAGFAVTLLKPRAKQLRYERVGVEQLSKFSGGQRVTAAIVIFATLVAMRSRAAGHPGHARSVLLLDNPIGKSSAGTLVNLQRQVAAQTGVQLVYATGVNDLGALGQFTRIIRLDGRENLRTGDTHLVADTATSTTLDAVGLTQRDLEEHDDLDDEDPPADEPDPEMAEELTVGN